MFRSMVMFSLIFFSMNLIAAEDIMKNEVGAASKSAVASGTLAAPGSTQYVIFMNALSNPATVNLTKSDVMIKLYDGTGNNPPCWTLEKVAYHNNPYVAGAGGKNACGTLGTSAGIVKIDVVPLIAPAGKVYEDLIGVTIDAKKFYTGVIIEQATPPSFNSNGSLNTLGTLKVSKMVEQPATSKN